MVCFHPITGFRSRAGTLTHSRANAYIDRKMTVKCGQCIGCRLQHSHMWAIRCVHEASQHEGNHFITLTYDDDHLPRDGSLNHEHFQKFMKRLRKSLSGKRISYYMCGEYGEKLERPHYHALIFGHRFRELTLGGKSGKGEALFHSAELEKLWPLGRSSAQDVNFKTASYCSRYVTKKITGKRAEEHYLRTNPDTLETYQLAPEYARMSLKPAIGATWAERYDKDNYPSDFVVIEGRKCPIPSYYDRLKEKVSPEALERIKLKRIASAARHAANNTPERLAVRETVLKSRTKTLKRNLEQGN